MHHDIPKNQPHLIAPTSVRVLRPFYVKGSVVEVGSVVELEFHLAKDLEARGKVEITT